jgi:hypothetical protein
MGDETESVRLKCAAQRGEDRIEIAAGFDVRDDIGQQRQTRSGIGRRSRDHRRVGEQRFFARRLDVFAGGGIQAGERGAGGEHLRRELRGAHFEISAFDAEIAYRGAGQKSPGQYRAKRGPEAYHGEPRYDSRPRPIERQCADKHKQGRRSRRDPETQVSDVGINAEHRKAHAG